MSLSYLTTYALLSVLCTLLYAFSVRQKTHFGWARMSIWGVLVMPIVLPLIRVETTAPAKLSTWQSAATALPELLVQAQNAAPLKSSFPLSMLYALVCVAMLIRLATGLWTIAIAVKRGAKYSYEEMTVVQSSGLSISSFHRYLFINDKPPVPEALYHELMHYRQRHTYDKVALEIILCFFWFNPLLWWLRKELHQNHEYSADRLCQAINSNYATALLAHTMHTTTASFLVQSFSFHPIKNRIVMLQKNKPLSLRARALVVMLSLLIMGAAVIMQSSIHAWAQSNNPTLPTSNNNKELEARPGSTTNKDTIATMAEVMPKYPGGVDSMLAFLTREIHYPKRAINAGIGSRVFVKFIVDVDGSVINPEVLVAQFFNEQGEKINLANDDYGFEAEALRVVKAMPKWTPGSNQGVPAKVFFNLPITFQMAKGTTVLEPKPKRKN